MSSSAGILLPIAAGFGGLIFLAGRKLLASISLSGARIENAKHKLSGILGDLSTKVDVELRKLDRLEKQLRQEASRHRRNPKRKHLEDQAMELVLKIEAAKHRQITLQQLRESKVDFDAEAWGQRT